MTYNPANVFAKILRNELPAYKIFETPACMAILDAFPTARGHALLIPKAPVVNLLDMSGETASAFFQELPRLCRAVMKATKADGVTVVVNNNEASSQVVFHAHVHVVPRFKGDSCIQYTKDPAVQNLSPDGFAKMAQLIIDNLEKPHGQ